MVESINIKNDEAYLRKIKEETKDPNEREREEELKEEEVEEEENQEE
jgi:hypothetical protein